MNIKTRLAAGALAVGAGLTALALAAAPVAAKSPADDAAKPRRQCFWANQVNNFAAENDEVVNVRVGVKDIYRLELFGGCHEIDWSQQIGIRSRGGSTICSGLDAELIVPSTIGPQRCTVRRVRKLTPAEVAALPPKAKP
ncbi:DUF6491 family protein [Phenylobacterium sp. J426]|uniref:DUF6491 family protein n=1 Tax=Phenylobacterium sp. J426 TaxID=2898439 RepID=UPI002150EF60|nr:DUF6491 family protein [Phenylobacterium sp. J426]MCR5874402.1 DUF6491 family protein [Phenylobacterium sp. J426]